MMKNLIQDIQQMGFGEEESIERYEMMHHEMMEGMAVFPGEVSLKPGETGSVLFLADKSGTFWYVCHQVKDVI